MVKNSLAFDRESEESATKKCSYSRLTSKVVSVSARSSLNGPVISYSSWCFSGVGRHV